MIKIALQSLGTGALGLVGGIFLAAFIREAGDDILPNLGDREMVAWFVYPWRSLALGIVFGVVAAIIENAVLWRNRQHFAGDRRPESVWVRTGAWLPMIVAVVVSGLAAWTMGWTPFPAPLGALAGVALTFPVEARLLRWTPEPN